MNREIKFRAWNAIERKLIPWESMRLWQMDSLGSPEIMQFTGLKDKNGKEIYFGDILATSNDGKDGCDVWTKDTFGLTVVKERDGELGVQFSNWAMSNDPDDENETVYHRGYVEVIGNIYGNPELPKTN